LPAHERAEGSGPGTPALFESGAPEHPGDISAADLLKQAPCGYVAIATDGTLLYVNPAFAALCGRDQQTLLRSRFQELLTPGGALFYETQFAPSLLIRGSLDEISLEIARPQGDLTPVFVNAVFRPAEGNTPSHFLLVAFGAKQRRKYEAELLRARRDSEKISEVMRRSSDAIIRFSIDGLIESWNLGAHQIFGFSATEAIGRPIDALIAEQSKAEVETLVKKVRRGVEVLAEVTGCRKNDESVDLSISVTPHMEAPGIFVGFSAVLRDITARRLAEKALLQTEKLASVGRLASSIAHEINNPLEAVTNLLYILGTKVEDTETKALVETAQDELARVSQIATHTLRFHKQSTVRTEVDLQAVFDSVLGLYRARLQNSGIVVVKENRRCKRLICYEGELRQILVSLVANAFDAMRLGGKLILRSQEIGLPNEEAKGIRITVADNGYGIEPAAFKHLFEPFFSTKGIGGAGLGLWIARDLVRKNQGTIKIRSSIRSGRAGTVVNMVFPAEAP
jgi:PAS domain S-box-containing protein